MRVSQSRAPGDQAQTSLDYSSGAFRRLGASVSYNRPSFAETSTYVINVRATFSMSFTYYTRCDTSGAPHNSCLLQSTLQALKVFCQS